MVKDHFFAFLEVTRSLKTVVHVIGIARKLCMSTHSHPIIMHVHTVYSHVQTIIILTV